MYFSNRRVNVEKVMSFVNPLSGDLWGCAAISVDEITKAIECGIRETRPYNTIKDQPGVIDDWRSYHISRIAELAREKIDDQTEGREIFISVSVDSNFVTIEEGRHRIVAAYFRGQETVCAKILENEPGDFDQFFGQD